MEERIMRRSTALWIILAVVSWVVMIIAFYVAFSTYSATVYIFAKWTLAVHFVAAVVCGVRFLLRAMKGNPAPWLGLWM